MAGTVYVVGAGINMVVRHRTRDVRPPLARNFFRQLHEGLGEEELERLFEGNRRLYDYIRHYWKLDLRALSEADFDLEECYTLLQQHENDAIRRKDGADRDNLWDIKGQLTSLFAGLLQEISEMRPPEDPGLGPLARRVLDEGAAVVTFNYDTLLERAMIAESSAGGPGLSSWDPIPAYGAPLNEYEPRIGEPPEPFRSARFPLQEHRAPFLKLHGSLNWFRHAGGPPGGLPGSTLVRRVDAPAVRPARGDTIVMGDGAPWERLIITPVLNKAVDREPFATLWQKAKEEMRGCSRLVIGGYSFPPSDFATRRLFLEAFVGGPPDELVVINPDEEVDSRAKHLCHHEGEVTHHDGLDEYLASRPSVA